MKFRKIILNLLIVMIFASNITTYAQNQKSDELSTNKPGNKEGKNQTSIDAKKSEKKVEEPKKEEPKKDEPKKIESKPEPKEEQKKTNKIIENVDQFGKKFGNMPSRQFLKFQTKQGNILYILIDYTDVGEEIKVLTEVSDKDVLSMTTHEFKEEIQKKIIESHENKKEKQLKESKELIKKQEDNSASLSTFQILLIVFCLVGAIGLLIIKFRKGKVKPDYEI